MNLFCCYYTSNNVVTATVMTLQLSHIRPPISATLFTIKIEFPALELTSFEQAML